MIAGKDVPKEPIRIQLANHIAAGASGDDAVAKVMDPYQPSPLADFAWPAVRHLALHLERDHHRLVEEQAMGPVRLAARRQTRQRAKLLLPRMTFRLGDGTAVEWERATRQQHLARVAWQNCQIDGIERDKARHLRAVELIDSHGVTCLGDIAGWVDLMGDDAPMPEDPAVDASTPAVDASSVGTRKPVTGGKAGTGRAKPASRARVA